MSGQIPDIPAGISADGARPLPPDGIAGPLARTDSLAGLSADYGEFRPVPRLIEDQADLTPGRTAVCYGGRELSYDRLDRLASGLAAAVAATGVGQGDRVATSVVNSLELPVAYLALMKLGAVFVPVDPGWPASRLATTLRVLSPRLILCLDPGQVPPQFGALAMPVAADQITPSPRRPAVALAPADLCYGFFTSGTTGTPKCALNRHGGLANRLRFMTRWFGAAGDDVVLQNSKHTFDSSLWQLLWPLITGGRAVLPAAGEFLDLQHTIDTIAEHRVTATDFVSSIFNILVTMADRDEQARRKLASLRCLVVGSEEINARAVHRMRELLPQLAITNGYGPTETTIGMVFHPVSDADGDVIPLGRPIDNCYVAVLGPDRAVLPRGTIGEIAIGGACVGAGYHGNRAATGLVFIPNHLAGRIPGDLLYLSGDTGYLDEAGRLFFSGRKDFQVKIGGVRIELGEIEAAAQRCPGVSQAKALVVERDGVKSLALFAAGNGRPREPTGSALTGSAQAGSAQTGSAQTGSALTGSALTESVLREHLRRLLPRTSLPGHCLVLDRMPLGEVGKIDWRALQAMLDRRLDAAGGDAAGRDSPDSSGRDAAGTDAPGQPASWNELTLRAFRVVLGHPDLGPDEDFMAAGGDSIRALVAVRLLTDECGVPDLCAQDLIEQPTARELAGLIATREPSAAAAAAEAAQMERDATAPPPSPEPGTSRLPAAGQAGAGRACGGAAFTGATQAAGGATQAAGGAGGAGPPGVRCTVLVTGATQAAGGAGGAGRPGELRTVLVTGATGFVGAELVHDLLSRTDLRVACLARAASDAGAADRVAAALAARGRWRPSFASRIDGYAGDLGQPDLGLSQAAWQHLARRCDLVLHNGALVNLLFSYAAHRAANVTGTAGVLRLAMSGRPVPLHYVSTLSALQAQAAQRVSRGAGRLPEVACPAAAEPPGRGYSRSKWVAERYLAGARREGALITVLRLGEVLPGARQVQPNSRALTHLLLSAIHRLGVFPDAAIRSDYTPADYVAVRVTAAVLDRAAWGRVLHVLHPDAVCFAGALSAVGAPVTRVSCAEFLTRLGAAGRDGDRELAGLAALLPWPDGRDEPALRRALAGLLTDNPALYRKDECQRLEERWQLTDPELRGPIAAYHAYLAGTGGPGPPRQPGPGGTAGAAPAGPALATAYQPTGGP